MKELPERQKENKKKEILENKKWITKLVSLIRSFYFNLTREKHLSEEKICGFRELIIVKD